ncbi:MAG: hypothetical protein ACHQX4_03000 [Gemmatimonadales bacterium]
MPTFGQQAMIEALLAEFPGLREDIADAGGALHLEMGEFAAFTQASKGRGDWPTYERCIQLADRLFADADAALRGAFRASYFEHLDFEGTRGPAAWQLLTPRLQAAWKQMDAENRRLMALPQQQRKDSKEVKGRKGRADRKGGGRRRR